MPHFPGCVVVDKLETWDSDDEGEEELAPELEADFVNFFMNTPNGPRLYQDTVDLLADYGVNNQERLVVFSQLSFEKILASLTRQDLHDLSKEGLTNLKAYGMYLSSHDLITPLGLINLDAFTSMPMSYHMYKKLERRTISRAFRKAFWAEVDSRIRSSRSRYTLFSGRGIPQHSATLTPGAGKAVDPGSGTSAGMLRHSSMALRSSPLTQRSNH